MSLLLVGLIRPMPISLRIPWRCWPAWPIPRSIISCRRAPICLPSVRRSRPADAEHRFGHGKAEPRWRGWQAGRLHSAPRRSSSGDPEEGGAAAARRRSAGEPFAASDDRDACVSIFAAIYLILYQQPRRGQNRLARHHRRRRPLFRRSGQQYRRLVAAILLVAQPGAYLGWLSRSRHRPAGGFGAGGQRLERFPPEPGSVDGPPAAPGEERAKIITIVRGHDGCPRSLHELKTRQAGLRHFHPGAYRGSTPPCPSPGRTRSAMRGGESDLCAAFPNAEVIIHQDPAGYGRQGFGTGWPHLDARVFARPGASRVLSRTSVRSPGRPKSLATVRG